MSEGIVFLDKDGTLIENLPYNVDPSLIRLSNGAGPSLRRLHQAGWRIAVVSNQSGVARGLFPESALQCVESRLRELLEEFVVPLEGFFYCPHHPEGSIEKYAIHCDCRKPGPGLLLKACEQFKAEAADCWMIGDSSSDVEAGKNAGCRTILINSSLGSNDANECSLVHKKASDITAAINLVLRS
jgi:D-glycero-D-manno-heptose 1,7-bisphosphate phosphatase